MVQNIGVATRTVNTLPVATSVAQADVTVIQTTAGITKQATLGTIIDNLVPEITGRVAINIEDYGPVGNGNPDEDTLAWQTALYASASLGLPVIGDGTYYIRPRSTPIGQYAGASTLPGIYSGVSLPSGCAVDGLSGRSITFVPYPMSVAASSNAKTIMFSTAQTSKLTGSWVIPTQAATSNISFKNVNFLFDATLFPAGLLHSPTYALGACGTDGFVEENNYYTFTGADPVSPAFRGRASFFWNTINRRNINTRYKNISQGSFVGYEYNTVVDGISGVSVGEFQDLDAPCYNCTYTNMDIRDSTGEGDVLDTGGGNGNRFSNSYFEDTGAAILVYTKNTAWSTFQRWVEAEESISVSAGECQVPNGYVVENFTIVSCRRPQGEQAAILIGQDRPNDWRFGNLPDNRNNTFRNITLTRCSGIFVAGAENVTLDNIVFTSCTGIEKDNKPTLAVLQSEASAGVSDFTAISGSFTNITINQSSNVGIRVEAPSRQYWNNITINGYGQDPSVSASNFGLQGMRLNRKKGLVTFSNINIRGGGTSAPTDFWLAGTSAPVTTSAGPNQLAFVQPLIFATSGANAPNLLNRTKDNIVWPLPQTYFLESLSTSVAATPNDQIRKPMFIMPPGKRARFLQAAVAGTSAVTSAGNYTSIVCYKQSGTNIQTIDGTSTDYDNTSRTEGAIVSIGVDPFTTNTAIVSSGAMFGFGFIRRNSGSIVQPLVLQAQFLNWSTGVSNGW